jgi:hypothetical protein
MRIEIADDIGRALEARAAAQGLALETWFKQLAGNESSRLLPSHEAAAGIIELQKLVKPDPQGWTVRDYINSGRR